MKYLSTLLISVLMVTVTMAQNNNKKKYDVNPDSLRIKQQRYTSSPKPKYKKLSVSGTVRMVGTMDFGKHMILNQNDFITSSIPLEVSKAETARLTADLRESNIALDGNFKFGREIVHSYIEVAIASNGDLDLHLAYIDAWNFHIGRDWTTFSNLNAIPNQVDFEGSNALTLPINDQIRYSRQLNKKWTIDLALEIHAADFTPIVTTDPKYQSVPDFVAKITKTGQWGEVSLAGVARLITYLSAPEDTKNIFGGGTMIAGVINLFPTAHNTQKDNLMFSGVVGSGIQYYIDDLSGLGLDAAPLHSPNSIDALSSIGGYMAYQHYWSKNTSSTAVAGYLDLEENKYLPVQTFKNSQYFAVNFMATPFSNFSFGIEFMHGKLKAQNNKNASANRIQTMVSYSF